MSLISLLVYSVNSRFDYLSRYRGFSVVSTQAQATVEQREQLLNGLRICSDRATQIKDVLIKVRIHSGAAFEAVGQAGQMAILSDKGNQARADTKASGKG